MKSALPKMLQPLAGRPLVHYAVRAATDAGADEVVVVASPATLDAIRAYLEVEFDDILIRCVVQDPPRGTGDAARVGLEAAGASARVLIVNGDVPLLGAKDLRRAVDALGSDDVTLALLSCQLDDPRGYGRVLRDEDGRVREVREQRDLQTDAEHAVREMNAGIYAAKRRELDAALAEVRPDNAQGEYYLTDVVETLGKARGAVAIESNPDAMHGINDRAQLDAVERMLFSRIADGHRIRGVTVRGDARIDDTVEIAPDATIEAGVTLRGGSKVGARARIDVGSVVTDSEIQEDAYLKPYCVVTSSRVGPSAQIGPFAHLRPQSEIEQDAHIGNFVETKKTRVRKGAKANHLAYLGDGDIGEGANVGAGTIFCNYDGFQKHQTTIGEGAFIGSDSQLVAPITVGKGAYVGTGTTVTKDVPDGALAIGRAKQDNKEGYARRLKSRLESAARRAKEDNPPK